MKVTIDIDEYGDSVNDILYESRNEIVRRIVDKINVELYKPQVEEVKKEMSEAVSNCLEEIKQKIVDSALRKRDLRELCTSDSNNRKFIEEVVNECIIKKFGLCVKF